QARLSRGVFPGPLSTSHGQAQGERRSLAWVVGMRFFGPRCVGRAIIMPPLMLRWRPLHITILSLGTIASCGWVARAVAADPPLCPSQPAPPPAQSPVPAGDSEPKEPKPEVTDAAIDIHADHATLGVDGNATLQGNVTVRQGERQINADEIQYNSKTN